MKRQPGRRQVGLSLDHENVDWLENEAWRRRSNRSELANRILADARRLSESGELDDMIELPEVAPELRAA